MLGRLVLLLAAGRSSFPSSTSIATLSPLCPEPRAHFSLSSFHFCTTPATRLAPQPLRAAPHFAAPPPLSRGKQEQKKKELEDLDAVLAELGLEAAADADTAAAEADAAASAKAAKRKAKKAQQQQGGGGAANGSGAGSADSSAENKVRLWWAWWAW